VDDGSVDAWGEVMEEGKDKEKRERNAAASALPIASSAVGLAAGPNVSSIAPDAGVAVAAVPSDLPPTSPLARRLQVIDSLVASGLFESDWDEWGSVGSNGSRTSPQQILPCPHCGSILTWWDWHDGRHCMVCEGGEVDKRLRLQARTLEKVAVIRVKTKNAVDKEAVKRMAEKKKRGEAAGAKTKMVEVMTMDTDTDTDGCDGGDGDCTGEN
jgi:hypothetical protein